MDSGEWEILYIEREESERILDYSFSVGIFFKADEIKEKKKN